MEKSDLVRLSYVDADLSKLFDQISKLTGNIDKITSENSKLGSDVVITQKVKNRLEEKITYLPEKQAKGKKYSRRNKEQLTVIPSSIPDEDLENTMVYMLKDSGIDVGLEILSDVTDSISQVLVEVTIKKITVKFINREHSKALLKHKKPLRG